MRFWVAVGILLLVCGLGFAEDPARTKDKHAPPVEGKAVTVPAVIDHNRMIIDVAVRLLGGKSERVQALVDNGNPDLIISQRLAEATGRAAICEWQTCGTSAPAGVVIGDMEISFQNVRIMGAKFTVKQDHPHAPAFPGVDAEMNIPSTVLRHYDVLIDFPGHKFTIGTPGRIHFNGVSAKVQINPDTGVVRVPSKIDNKKYDLELDLGSPLSLMPTSLFDALAAAHPDWPHMTGAIGPASESDGDQVKRRVMRVDRLQFGPLFLTNVAVGDWGGGRINLPGKLGDVSGAGLLGSEALQNYRVGIDYAHSIVYFDIGRLSNFPDFDVIGLILRPEDDGRFSILGVADFDGKPSVPSGPDGVQPGDHLVAVDDIPVQGVTLGQVWSMLGGTPGLERILTIERDGKQFVVAASVRHFLAELPDDGDRKKKK